MRLNHKRATILVCSVAAAAFTTAAVARPVHHHHRHRVAHTGHTAVRTANDVADRDMRYPGHFTRVEAGTRQLRSRHGRRSAMEARAEAQSHADSAYRGFTSNALVAEARKYLGTHPTGRRSLWCGAFMDMVLRRTGHRGGGNLALGYEHYGTRVSGPQVGAIAVMGRRGGGHVGVVSGIDANGNPIIVSGNHNHTVAESVYPRGRIAAYVVPN
jgi:uncharacterized protein (TIGR02594 family)